MEKAYLAVEGGGSKARAILEYRGVVTARTEWYGLNPRDVGLAEFSSRLGSLLVPLLSRLPARQAEISACVAAAGLGSPAYRMLCEPAIRRLLEHHGICWRLELLSDIEALVEAFLDERDGVILIAGTGSVCVAVKHTRAGVVRARVGGRGGVLDRGSGYWLGFHVLKHAIGVRDGLERSSGTLEVLGRRYGVKAQQVAARLIPPLRHEIAGIVPALLEAYADQDRFAQALVRRGAVNLAAIITAAAKRAGLAGRFGIYLAGGLFESPVVRGLIRQEITRRSPQAVIHRVREPLLAVLGLARAHVRPARDPH
jgi:N-acetylglucosamine kinase-like BadF-type ATPase